MDRIMLNFSGGFDSLTAASMLAAEVKELYLVTFRVATEKMTFLAARNLDKLRKDFPDTRIVHDVVDIRDIHKKIRRDFPENVEKFRGSWPALGLWCCTCQLAMRTASIVYCLEKGITWCADGSITAEYHHASHKVKFINRIKRLYAEYGLRFITPVYHFSEDTKEYLKRNGYKVGLELYALKTTQPLCFFTFFSVLRQMCSTQATPEEVVDEYVSVMIPVMRGTVDETISKKGIDLSEERGIVLSDKDFVEYVPVQQREKAKARWSTRILRVIAEPFYLCFDLAVRIRRQKKRKVEEG